MQIPKSYLLLQAAVLAERLRRDLEDEVQYLTDLQLEQIIEQNPDSDIKDYEDLQTGQSSPRLIVQDPFLSELPIPVLAPTPS